MELKRPLRKGTSNAMKRMDKLSKLRIRFSPGPFLEAHEQELITLQQYFGDIEIQRGKAKHTIEKEPARTKVVINTREDYVVKTSLRRMMEFTFRYHQSYINIIRLDFLYALPNLLGVNFNELYMATRVPHDVPDSPPSDKEAAEKGVRVRRSSRKKKKKKKKRWSYHTSICFFTLFYFCSHFVVMLPTGKIQRGVLH